MAILTVIANLGFLHQTQKLNKSGLGWQNEFRMKAYGSIKGNKIVKTNQKIETRSSHNL